MSNYDDHEEVAIHNDNDHIGTTSNQPVTSSFNNNNNSVSGNGFVNKFNNFFTPERQLNYGLYFAIANTALSILILAYNSSTFFSTVMASELSDDIQTWIGISVFMFVIYVTCLFCSVCGILVYFAKTSEEKELKENFPFFLSFIWFIGSILAVLVGIFWFSISFVIMSAMYTAFGGGHYFLQIFFWLLTIPFVFVSGLQFYWSYRAKQQLYESIE
ncbi:hypothetical protein ABK040_009489 [Willaertia magna]